jgi:plastocyanin
MSNQGDKGDAILKGPFGDGVDRRGFLKCMAWAGAGLVWTLSGGVPSSRLFGATGHAGHDGNGFSFVQISDSHIGFNKGANPDVTGTFQTAIDKINSLPAVPDLILHTGDLTQISKPGEFDTVEQVLKGAKATQVFYTPGEHDFATDNGEQFLQRYGKSTKGRGWQSFDHKGVHFIGLVNVANLRAGGMGSLGADQLEWLEDDVKGLAASTPVVVFAHIPLWAVYPEWGWGTEDSAQALAYLKRFGSVTVLNGHIHQIMQKVEGNVSFHTAMATAFPQPVPGTAPSAGPLGVPADDLRKVLGITQVNFMAGSHHLAVVDATLAGTPAEESVEILKRAGAAATSKAAAQTQARAADGQAANKPASGASGEVVQVSIDNFSFTPQTLTVRKGTSVVWTNHDDIPHTVDENDLVFVSSVLDTNQKFQHAFQTAGRFPYYCRLHPRMTGTVVVE